MQPRCTSLCGRGPATIPCPQPHGWTSHPSCVRPVLISFHLSLRLSSSLFPSCFPDKTYAPPLYLQCKLHVLFTDFQAVLGSLLAGVNDDDLEFRERYELVVAIGRFTWHFSNLTLRCVVSYRPLIRRPLQHVGMPRVAYLNIITGNDRVWSPVAAGRAPLAR